MEPRLAQLLDLHGKVAIVTGGAMGIGQAIASRLAEAGASVLITDINEEAGSQAVQQITGEGGQAAFLQADAASVSDAARVAETAVSTFGRLDMLVNNAGIYPPSPAVEMTEALWNRVISINLSGVFFYAQAAAKMMIAAGHGGRIVNIASVDAFVPAGNLTHYDAAKGGVVMVTKSLAYELGKHHILVNAIAPGGVDTPGTRSIAAERFGDRAIDLTTSHRSVLGRNAVPDDIARAVFFLVSGLADYITGSVVLVDGGYLLL